jgi:hypothetical protein
MHELYKSISRTSIVIAVNKVWKSMDHYRLRCIDTSIRGEVVKFEIQLYQIEVGNFLVDFKIISNGTKEILENVDHRSIFTFIDSCTKLITELAVAS